MSSFLNLVIFVLLIGLGYAFFPQTGGPLSGFFFIGEQLVGSNLDSQGNDLVTQIITFIISAGIYYFIATVITFILTKIFSRD